VWDQLLPAEEISVSQTKTLETPVKDLTTGVIIAGKYKLLEDLGEGGMETVFVAEQTEPVRRRIAFKIIKLGMDTMAVSSEDVFVFLIYIFAIQSSRRES